MNELQPRQHAHTFINKLILNKSPLKTFYYTLINKQVNEKFFFRFSEISFLFINIFYFSQIQKIKVLIQILNQLFKSFIYQLIRDMIYLKKNSSKIF